jgi:predicted ATP-grasp superfamily ATP-dependent carboligase
LTAATVLVAALAGRGLAASARRAGYLPLVADAFGDSDTEEHAFKVRRVGDAARIGFRTKPVLSALAELAAAAPSAPLGLVLGSGFEDRPRLIAALASRYRLLGNDAATTARAKSPTALVAQLDALGIRHPDTQLAPPADPAGWLSKRIGGSGGAHIVAAADADLSARRYYQRRRAGELSALAVATRDGARLVGISRQWTVGAGPRPYRYGGAVGPVDLDPGIARVIHKAVHALSAALRLVGLVSFDFLLVDGAPWLLEVNPRPSATLDVFDDAAGTLFRAHLAACAGATPPPLPPREGACAAAILYADRGRLGVGTGHWPEWTADRPPPGTRIPRYHPVATVFARGATPEAALRSCRARLDELGEMLYAQAPTRERTNDAEVHRPGPERLGARSQAR